MYSLAAALVALCCAAMSILPVEVRMGAHLPVAHASEGVALASPVCARLCWRRHWPLCSAECHCCAATGSSQPELGTNRIVRFVTKQAPAPQALKFGGGCSRRRGGACTVLDCELIASHLGLQAAPNVAISMGVHWHARPMRRRP